MYLPLLPPYTPTHTHTRCGTVVVYVLPLHFIRLFYFFVLCRVYFLTHLCQAKVFLVGKMAIFCVSVFVCVLFVCLFFAAQCQRTEGETDRQRDRQAGS